MPGKIAATSARNAAVKAGYMITCRQEGDQIRVWLVSKGKEAPKPEPIPAWQTRIFAESTARNAEPQKEIEEMDEEQADEAEELEKEVDAPEPELNDIPHSELKKHIGRPKGSLNKGTKTKRIQATIEEEDEVVLSSDDEDDEDDEPVWLTDNPYRLETKLEAGILCQDAYELRMGRINAIVAGDVDEQLRIEAELIENGAE